MRNTSYFIEILFTTGLFRIYIYIYTVSYIYIYIYGSYSASPPNGPDDGSFHC